MPRTEHGEDGSPFDLPESYDRIAADYAERFAAELAHKPLDRALLDALADETREDGQIADLGCGPGQVAKYLSERGCRVVGVDISPGMVAVARTLNPDIEFVVGSLLDLPVPDGVWAGIVAFYSLIHVTPDAVAVALAEMFRALRPGGRALVSFHVGVECVHLDDWWGHPVSLDFQFMEIDAVVRGLEAAGFTVHAKLERRAYEPHEYPSARGYVLARKPS